jgi:NAD+ kinase
MSKSKSALIFANLNKNDAGHAAQIVQAQLGDRGWRAEVLAFHGPISEYPDFSQYGLLVSLGGDGTLLYAASFAGPLGIPILPINLGTLGFIAANKMDTWAATFDGWQDRAIEVSKRLMLKVQAYRKNKILYKGIALNDIVVSSEGNARMIRMCLYVNKECFGHYRADGLIVSTPTGSTAYNLAAGGPAVHPEISALIINPICPFTLASRPLVIPGTLAVEIAIDETKKTGALLTVDGHEMISLERDDVVKIEKYKKPALLVVPSGNAFFSALRTKLGWSGDSDA